MIEHKTELGLSDDEVKQIENYRVNKSSGIVAGNNVYVSGLNVNLDGLVQSGYKEFKVTLDKKSNKKSVTWIRPTLLIRLRLQISMLCPTRSIA
mgnify:CR=1 FL=1